MQYCFKEITFQSYEEFLEKRVCFHKRLQEVLPKHKEHFEQAVLEAINNAFLHGQIPGKEVYVQLKATFMKRRLVIRIKDHGKGFKAEKKITDIKENYDAYLKKNLLQERGRGIPIMAKTSDYMRYNKKGNEVLLVCRW